MRVILEITSGPHAGRKIELEEGQSLRVGRNDKADFPTRDTFMSSVHFAVECAGGVCRIQDLQSRNGTLLNGEGLVSSVLRKGDKIFAGSTDFVVHLEESEPPASLKTTVPLPATPPQGPTIPDALPVRTRPEEDRRTRVEIDRRTRVEEDSTREPAPQPQQDAQAQRHVPPKASPPPVVQAMPPASEVQRPLKVQRPLNGGVAKGDYGTEADKGPLTGEVSFSKLPPEVRVQKIMEKAAASTPKGRLLQILREQPEPLFVLLDAIHEPKVIELLHVAQEELQPLYEGGRHAPEKIPYLARLSAQSPLLEALVNEGWGKNWGVFLTCPAPLAELRRYFRQELMVKTQDGREFFFRFYEPRFLRDTLRSSSYADSVKFFGPVTSYLIEAEKPEILLQCTRARQSVEIRERLLLLPGT